MLAVGAEKIKGLCVGEQKITAAYLGGEQVFSGKKPSRLPEGYTEVAYIQTDGTSSTYTINTGVTANKYIKAVADMEILGATGSKTQYFFRAQNSLNPPNSYSFYIMFREKSGMVAKYYNNSEIVVDANKTPRRMVATLDGPNKTATVDGTSVRLSSSLSATIGTIYLFYSASSTNRMPSKMYSCQIYKSEVLLRDFVPCVDPAGIPGLFDLVESKFYKNSGTAFITGPAV